jgi:hypothetical protein
MIYGGEGGIRTHVPLTGQDAFEAPPLRPLRYLSGRVMVRLPRSCVERSANREARHRLRVSGTYCERLIIPPQACPDQIVGDMCTACSKPIAARGIPPGCGATLPAARAAFMVADKSRCHDRLTSLGAPRIASPRPPRESAGSSGRSRPRGTPAWPSSIVISTRSLLMSSRRRTNRLM